MAVQNVQGGDEELVRVVLLVPGQMLCVRPDQVEHSIGHEWTTVGAPIAVKLLKILEKLKNFSLKIQ